MSATARSAPGESQASEVRTSALSPDAAPTVRRRGAEPPPARPADGAGVVVGKDIVELLSSAMYVDPLTVYREYIQNAADAVDAAVAAGLLADRAAGRIAIHVDHVDREFRIRDNGIGVAREVAERILTAFGASQKRGQRARGFRGVGRLAALGYGQALTFRTKAAGERRGTEVRWDCRKLRAVLLDPAYTGAIGDVVRDVVTVQDGPEEDPSAHYFEVHLERVVRLRNDVLLNDAVVRRYLSQVAPVPMPRDFAFTPAIETHLEQHLPGGGFDIRVNDGSPLERPFSDAFAVTLGKSDNFTDVQLLTFEDPDAGVTAAGWVLHHGYLGAIQSAPEIRGLRARVGDVQIGNADIFADVFPEPRFNGWAVGEVHVLDRRVVPNGRRDNFEQNAASSALFNHLVPVARDLSRRCRGSSAQRVRLKRFDAQEQHVRELLDIYEQGSLGRAAAATLAKDVGTGLGEMERLAGADLFPEGQQRTLRTRIERLRARYATAAGKSDAPDPLQGVPQRNRAAYRQMIELIYECSGNRAAAKALVDRITSRLAGAGAAS